MRYSARVFQNLDELDLDQWQAIHREVGDAFSDPCFLRVMEDTVGHVTPCRPVIFYDGAETPVGITTLSSCPIDAAQMAPKWAQHLVAWIRRLWPRYLYFQTVMCGPAVAILQEKLYLRRDVDHREILLLLDELLCERAREIRANVILIGDFDVIDRSWLDTLLDVGYAAGDSHPAFRLELPFRSFEEYLACMHSEPRRQIRQAQKRLHRAAATVHHYTGGAAAAAFTKQHYLFYLELLERVDLSMSTLPFDFFQALLREFPEVVHFVDIRIKDQPVAFSIALQTEGRCEALFVGYDHELNREHALYFNAFFEMIDDALQANCKTVELGGTADFFKTRLGAHPRARTLYVKACGWLRRPLHWFSGLLLPPHPPPQRRKIFIRKPQERDATDRTG